MFSWIRNKLRGKPDDDADALIGLSAKQELEATVESLLLAHHTQHGADSLLNPDLRIVAIGERIELATEPINDAICEVKLRELPTVLSFLVVREENLAVPRDVVANIATEAARLMAKRVNALDV
jgi:hypothetical protein